MNRRRTAFKVRAKCPETLLCRILGAFLDMTIPMMRGDQSHLGDNIAEVGRMGER